MSLNGADGIYGVPSAAAKCHVDVLPLSAGRVGKDFLDNEVLRSGFDGSTDTGQGSGNERNLCKRIDGCFHFSLAFLMFGVQWPPNPFFRL